MYPLRAIPWWTPQAVSFVANVTKWLPSFKQKKLTALEIGGGNSTFFLLNKGIKTTTVDDDIGFIEFIASVAKAAGYSVTVLDHFPKTQIDSDLTLVQTPGQTGLAPGSRYKKLGIDNIDLDFDIVINDGIDRLFFLKKFSYLESALMIIDNCENAANWGRLLTSSGKLDLVKEYRGFLRAADRTTLLFEQPEGRDKHSAQDQTGWEAPCRWVTGISWHKNSLYNELMLTSQGLPLVNAQGLSNADLESLSRRCPYDSENKQWLTESDYPPALDLGLNRLFD